MIPNLFVKQAIPQKLPPILQKEVDQIAHVPTQELAAQAAFDFVTSRWGGNRLGLIRYFPRLFQTNIFKIISTSGYMHCTTMNFLVRILLVKSGRFTDTNVHLKLTHTWYAVPHQYLTLHFDSGRELVLDPWNFQFGIRYGSFGKGFDSTTFTSNFKSL